MQYRVAYEHSLKDHADDFIVHMPSQLIDTVPANILRALLLKYITELILSRSPTMSKIPNLLVL